MANKKTSARARKKKPRAQVIEELREFGKPSREKLDEFVKQLRKLKFPESPIVKFVINGIESYLSQCKSYSSGPYPTLDQALGLARYVGNQKSPSKHLKLYAQIYAKQLDGKSWLEILDELQNVPVNDARVLRRICRHIEQNSENDQELRDAMIEQIAQELPLRLPTWEFVPQRGEGAADELMRPRGLVDQLMRARGVWGFWAP
jgi:hypothetical protein